ncbi:MAG: hypothetical protein FJ150_11100 [Euryarchaeota archaeon]|nr:hypothetical protein [Euryarchaeota archaeon]
MVNKDKLIIALIAIIILLVAVAGYMFFSPSGNITDNVTNNTTSVNVTEKGPSPSNGTTPTLIDSGSMNGTFSGEWELYTNYTYTWKTYRYNDSYIKIYTSCNLHNYTRTVDQTITLTKKPPGTLTIFIEPKMTGTSNYMTTVHTTSTALEYYWNVWRPGMAASGPSH